MFSLSIKQYIFLSCFLATAIVTRSNADQGPNLDSTDIGTALFLSRKGDALQINSANDGPIVTPGASKKSSIRRMGDHFSANFFPRIILRTLKYGGSDGCSESHNSISAIVDCSNAVRADPDRFAKEYPCSYQSWRHEVSEKVLSSLKTMPVIMRLAQLHTDDQARMNSMTHTGSDGSDLQTRADRIELSWGTVGENVAVGFSTAKAVVMAWMCSPPHRKNLMSCDFSTIGVGAGVSPAGRHFYTQVFSCDISETCRCGSSPPAAQPKPAQPKPAQPKPAQPKPEEPKPAHDDSKSNCQWVNNQWTCGQHIKSKTHDYNPYGY